MSEKYLQMCYGHVVFHNSSLKQNVIQDQLRLQSALMLNYVQLPETSYSAAFSLHFYLLFIICT